MRLHSIPPRRRTGFTLVEVAVVLTILTISLAMFARTMASAKNLNPISTETAVAGSAARTVLEEMRNHPFEDVFALYNADPNDDPGGAGTAPGPNFAVPELAPTTAGGFVGSISFPTTAGVLREDTVDADLGMPRDLNADGVVDANSRADDYVLLPIRVRLTWVPRNARTGQRTFEMYTMYARF